VTKRLVLHPFLFTIFPTLFLLSQNVDQFVQGDTVLRVIALSLTITAALLFMGRLLLKDWTKAGIAVSILVVLFFSYGHVIDLLDRLGLANGGILLMVWGVVAIGGIVLAARSGPRLGATTKTLNVVSAILVLLNLIPIVTYQVRSRDAQQAVDLNAIDKRGIDLKGRPPDIYYLIFDRYQGLDTLKQQHGFDNTSMIEWLEAKGFYVARESRANYGRTPMGISSALNMRFLDFLTRQVGEKSSDFRPVEKTIQNSRAMRFLKSLGYRYYHIASGWDPTNEDPAADVNIEYGGTSEFSSVLYDTTVLRALDDFTRPVQGLGRRANHYRIVNFQFDTLHKLKDQPGPKVVFVHLLLPHPPYVFDRNGKFLTAERLAALRGEDLYVEQLLYTNKKIKELVQRLLSDTEESHPVVILQSDEGMHGLKYGFEQRTPWINATDEELQLEFSILNAYYLPRVDEPGLYPQITPVNTFRLIFNYYFGTDLALLPDRSYQFTDFDHLYRFFDVTKRVRASLHTDPENRT
jgi:hypothetical protein